MSKYRGYRNELMQLVSHKKALHKLIGHLDLRINYLTKQIAKDSEELEGYNFLVVGNKPTYHLLKGGETLCKVENNLRKNRNTYKHTTPPEGKELCKVCQLRAEPVKREIEKNEESEKQN